MPPAADAAGGTLIAYPSGRKVWYNNYRQNLTAILKSCADFMGYENQWKPKGSIVLEIVFGSSAQGSLRAAQNYGRGKRPGTAVGIGVLYRDGKRLP